MKSIISIFDIDNKLVIAREFMRLLRYRHNGEISLGVKSGNGVIELSNETTDIPRDMLKLISDWPKYEGVILQEMKDETITLPLSEVSILSPIDNPGKFLAIGMNYQKHRAESIDAGITPPRNQMWFSKQVSSINSPNGDIIKPDSTMMLDYEVELAFVIGEKCYKVNAEEASRYIFGYMVCNDVSMRDWQMHNMPDRIELMIGKSHDSHGPIGPWIVTSDEVPEPHNLKIECYVNGEIRQSSNTDDMIWNCYEQIEYLSSAMTLYPGDIIATGTPPGSGFSPRGSSGNADKGRKGNVFLQSGDVVRCEIESIGAIENNVV